jgi:hypothetical protein
MTFASLIANADRAAQVILGGVDVVYQPQSGASVTVTGIFDDAYVAVDNGNAGVEQVGPVVWLRLEDLPVHPDDDEPTITINSVDYIVRERQVDGTVGGSIRLLLHKADS